MKFLHLSDLHFGRKEQDNSKITNILKKITAQYPKHYIIITGDITDDGEESQFDNVAKELTPFIDRLFIVPGNHDYGPLGNFYSETSARLFDEKLCGLLNQKGTYVSKTKPVTNVLDGPDGKIMLIGLNSNLKTSNIFDFACGEIGTRQLSALNNVIEKAPRESIKIVCLHHHPFIHTDPFMQLTDSKKLFQVIYNRVDVLLFGHKHKMFAWQTPSRTGVKLILAAGNTIEGHRVHEITIEKGKLSRGEINDL